jgi:F-type H+-transporting ATPase subunit epsilon
MAETFELEIATPEKSVAKQPVIRAQIPGKNGYMGILPDHAPLLSELGFGTLTYATQQGGKFAIAIYGGYVEVLDNHVRVLADGAEQGKEIDAGRAQQELEKAKAAMSNPTDETLAAVNRAEARVDAAKKSASGEE